MRRFTLSIVQVKAGSSGGGSGSLRRRQRGDLHRDLAASNVQPIQLLHRLRGIRRGLIPAQD